MQAGIGYEIFPDRFFSFCQKKGTRDWHSELPSPQDFKEGKYKYGTVFYGGDINGISSKLEYIAELSVDFIYLTPIFSSPSNHRYDCSDYFTIDPMLGTEKDLKKLCSTAMENKIRIVLDIALNHVGDSHQWFIKATKGLKEKEFFRQINGSFTFWSDSKNLPELALENPELIDLLWRSEHSAMNKWMKAGISDWRLDCAYELGEEILRDIHKNIAHTQDHKIYAEAWTYPKKWLSNGYTHGIMNYYFKNIIDDFLNNTLDATQTGEILSYTIKDCTEEKLFPCWNILSTHDTPRIKNQYEDLWKLAVVMQFTLPGSPLIYYGEEIGMTGENDPYCRQPMRWELTEKENKTFDFYLNIIKLFKGSPALREGKFTRVFSNNQNILAYSRSTTKIDEYRLILINPTLKAQEFAAYTTESFLMNRAQMQDVFTQERYTIVCSSIKGMINPGSFLILQPLVDGTYTPYKRIITQ
jgi:glycosidase